MATKKTAAKKSAKKKGVNAGVVAAGAVAAAAAAGTAYYFYGAKGAKKHRAAAAKWATGMKREVIKDVRKARKLTAPLVAAAVDRAARGYKSARSIDPKDLSRAASELKRNWKMVAKEISDAGKYAGGVKKAPKKGAKKATKKRS